MWANNFEDVSFNRSKSCDISEFKDAISLCNNLVGKLSFNFDSCIDAFVETSASNIGPDNNPAVSNADLRMFPFSSSELANLEETEFPVAPCGLTPRTRSILKIAERRLLTTSEPISNMLSLTAGISIEVSICCGNLDFPIKAPY